MWNDYGWIRPGRSPDYVSLVPPLPPIPPPIPPPPPANSLVDADGNLLVDADGNILVDGGGSGPPPVDVVSLRDALGNLLVDADGNPVLDGSSPTPGIPTIFLSNATVTDMAAIGTTIGTLSAIGGTGVYTFTFTSNPGSLFSISGSNLNVAATLTPASDPISIMADNGAGSTVTQSFMITVTLTSGSPLLADGVSHPLLSDSTSKPLL